MRQVVGSLSGLLSEEKCEGGVLERCSGSKKEVRGFMGGFEAGHLWLGEEPREVMVLGLLFFSAGVWEAQANPCLCPTPILH